MGLIIHFIAILHTKHSMVQGNPTLCVHAARPSSSKGWMIYDSLFLAKLANQAYILRIIIIIIVIIIIIICL
jgi:hypothetical protein